MVKAKDPPDWEPTTSKFDRITDLVDIFGCVTPYNTDIQANNETDIHTALLVTLRLTQQMLKTPVKGR